MWYPGKPDPDRRHRTTYVFPISILPSPNAPLLEKDLQVQALYNDSCDYNYISSDFARTHLGITSTSISPSPSTSNPVSSSASSNTEAEPIQPLEHDTTLIWKSLPLSRYKQRAVFWIVPHAKFSVLFGRDDQDFNHDLRPERTQFQEGVKRGVLKKEAGGLRGYFRRGHHEENPTTLYTLPQLQEQLAEVMSCTDERKRSHERERAVNIWDPNVPAEVLFRKTVQPVKDAAEVGVKTAVKEPVVGESSKAVVEEGTEVDVKPDLKEGENEQVHEDQRAGDDAQRESTTEREEAEVAEVASDVAGEVVREAADEEVGEDAPIHLNGTDRKEETSDNVTPNASDTIPEGVATVVPAIAPDDASPSRTIPSPTPEDSSSPVTQILVQEADKSMSSIQEGLGVVPSTIEEPETPQTPEIIEPISLATIISKTRDIPITATRTTSTPNIHEVLESNRPPLPPRPYTIAPPLTNGNKQPILVLRPTPKPKPQNLNLKTPSAATSIFSPRAISSSETQPPIVRPLSLDLSPIVNPFASPDDTDSDDEHRLRESSPIADGNNALPSPREFNLSPDSDVSSTGAVVMLEDPSSKLKDILAMDAGEGDRTRRQGHEEKEIHAKKFLRIYKEVLRELLRWRESGADIRALRSPRLAKDISTSVGKQQEPERKRVTWKGKGKAIEKEKDTGKRKE